MAATLPLVLSLAAACADTNPRARERPDPETAFRARLGQPWELTRLGTLDIPAPPPGTPLDSPGRDLVPGRRPTIVFTMEPPGAGGRSFCNGYGGPFTLRGDSLRITEIVSSAVGCDGPDSLETRFFRALRDTRRFALDSATLALIAEDGTRIVFAPATASSPPVRPVP